MKMQEEREKREGKTQDDKYLDDPAIVEHKDDVIIKDEQIKQEVKKESKVIQQPPVVEETKIEEPQIQTKESPIEDSKIETTEN